MFRVAITLNWVHLGGIRGKPAQQGHRMPTYLVTPDGICPYHLLDRHLSILQLGHSVNRRPGFCSCSQTEAVELYPHKHISPDKVEKQKTHHTGGQEAQGHIQAALTCCVTSKVPSFLQASGLLYEMRGGVKSVAF